MPYKCIKKQRKWVRNNEKKMYHYWRGMCLRAGGNKCAVCGYGYNVKFLEIDHINGDGCHERRKKNGNGRGGLNSYRLKKIYYSIISCEKRYQILCKPCNFNKKIENNENGSVDIVEYYNPQLTLFGDIK